MGASIYGTDSGQTSIVTKATVEEVVATNPWGRSVYAAGRSVRQIAFLSTLPRLVVGGHATLDAPCRGLQCHEEMAVGPALERRESRRLGTKRYGASRGSSSL